MSWLNCVPVDFVCLQETHSISESEFTDWFSTTNLDINNNKKYKCISSPGAVRSSGVAILYLPQYTLEHCRRDTSGRLLSAEFSYGGYNFQVVCLYGPNNARDGQVFFESFYQAIDPSLPVFICGDFNTVHDPYLDRFGCNPTSPWAYNWLPVLNDLVDTFDLSDAWRKQHPDAQEYTWRRPCNSQGSRIDMIWVPTRYLGLISTVEIFPFFRSDHSYVYLVIDLPFEVERGKGLWKLNTSLLKDASFCKEIARFWAEWRPEQDRFRTLSAWWDAGKVRLRQLIRLLSWELSSAKKERIRQLSGSIENLQQKLDQGESSLADLESAKTALSAELEADARGAQIRAHIQWAEDGERSSSYFLRQEKLRGQQRLIAAIRRSDGTIARSTRDILAVWRDYYFGLFSAQPLAPTDRDFFVDSLQHKLSMFESESCEGPLTIPECLSALQNMALGKSPGVDGLPAEFFVKFWDVLGADLVRVLNDCYSAGKLCLSQRSGAITLLYKKGDILDTANWRPITLLCADYKIAAKALGNRLLTVIASVVSPDQSCNIPGRFMGENVRLLQDVCCYATNQAIPAALLSLDQEKAFDRVEWPFLEKVLIQMGFGPSFRRWVSLLYSSVNSTVIVNGHLSDAFPVSRGVRQGCPLSPLLYVLVAETMACAVRADTRIDGFPLPCSNRRVKISQYADDTTVLVCSDVSLVALFQLFERYERASGARLNPRKCCGLLLGPWRARPPETLPIQLRWSAESIRVLGCSINPAGTQDWGPLLGKLVTLVDTWKVRHLSFQGRTVVANTLGISTFLYLGSVCFIPPATIRQINRLVFPFIWSKKREWVRRSTLTQPSTLGGLGVVDLDRKLRSLAVLWVKRFLLGSDHPWSFFFRHFLRRMLLAEPVERVFHQHTPSPATLRKLPDFYRVVLESWYAVRGTRVDCSWVVPRQNSAPDLPLADLTAHAAYSALTRLDHVPPRCETKAPFVEWPTVWANLHHLRFLRQMRDTSWLICHGVLPTGVRLASFNMPVSPICHCGRRETLEHLFYHCPLAQDLVNWWFTLMRKHSNRIPCPSEWEMLFGYRRVLAVPAGFVALLGIIRHQLWCTRNRHRFDGIPPCSTATLTKVKSSFRFLARIQQRHCGQMLFTSRWLANDVLGSVSLSGVLSFAPHLQ